MEEEAKAIFPAAKTYELAKLTIMNMLHAYEQGAIPLHCLLETAFSTWTDDDLFSIRPELKPEADISTHPDITELEVLIKEKFPDIPYDPMVRCICEEVDYRHSIRSSPRRYYAAAMCMIEHGLDMMKLLHPEWVDSIDAYIESNK